MSLVTVSPKFQVVIPRAVRQALGIKPGQKIQVVHYDNRVELIPLKPVREMREFLKGIDTNVEKEPDRLKS
jgi:AbrB family looped-hinge helix DNA binding protein